MNNNSVTFYLPFEGFYGTMIDSRYDDQLEISELDSDRVNWPATRNNTAEQYVKKYSELCGISLEFVEISSPREYNFENDKLEVSANEADLIDLKTNLLSDSLFHEYVSEACISRDGFISFMSHKLEEWPDEWGHREWSVAFDFMADEDMFEEIDEWLHCNVSGYEFILLGDEDL